MTNLNSRHSPKISFYDKEEGEKGLIRQKFSDIQHDNPQLVREEIWGYKMGPSHREGGSNLSA